jgi:hypothetical protein
MSKCFLTRRRWYSLTTERSWRLFTNPEMRPSLAGPNQNFNGIKRPLYCVTMYPPDEQGNPMAEVRVYEVLPLPDTMEDLNDILA